MQRIDYVSRAAFLPAASRAAAELGKEDPLVTLLDAIPHFETMWDVLVTMGASNLYNPTMVAVPAEPDDVPCVTNPFTTDRMDAFPELTQLATHSFRGAITQWMGRHNFHDAWIADNAIATVLACAIYGTRSELGKRQPRWMRSLELECGLLPVEAPPVDWSAEWRFERVQRAGAWAKGVEERFHSVMKKNKAEIQFRQAERCDPNCAFYAAMRVAGFPFHAINPIMPSSSVRKDVQNYCDRTGLTLCPILCPVRPGLER